MTLLYDQFGREIQVKSKPEMREIAAVAVRDRWSSYPSKGLTPQKLAQILLEADGGDIYRQAELFEEMEEKDAHLFSQFQTRKNAVLSFDYEIQEYSSSRDDKKIADFVSEVLFGLPSFEDYQLDALDAIPKGYSIQEIIWQTDGRNVVISNIEWIHAKRAVFFEPTTQPWQKMGKIPKITTEAQPTYGEEMPPFKLIYHRYKARSGYDTRAGILRVCAWMYLFKNYSIKDWVAFAEIFGMPIRLGKYEPGAAQADRDALMTAIQSIGTDAAGIISKNTEIEFVETMKSGNSSENIFAQLADFCDRQMSKAIVGQTASSEGTPGKLGSEEIRDKVRADLIRADSEALSKTTRFQMIRPLVGYNFGWEKPLPWFKIKYEPSEDLRMLSQVYKNVWSMGQRIAEEDVSERFKIRLPEEGETVLPPPAAPSAGLPFAMKEHGAKGTGQRGKTRVIVAKDGQMSDDDWIAAYMKALEPSLKNIKAASLTEIEDWLRSRGSPPTEEEFMTGVSGILGRNYKKIDQVAITGAVGDIYSAYKLMGGVPRIGIGFGGPDVRAINFLSGLDKFYLSKFIDNPDAQAGLTQFLKDRYLEGGSGLFGRGDPQTIADMKNLLSQKMTDLEGYQIRRIAETGTMRIKNWANLEQLHEGAVAEIEIVEPTQECAFCASMNGKVISVDTAHTRMSALSQMTPEDYERELRASQASLDNIEQFVEQGDLPPYHPHCRGRIIKRTG